jgi:hypothetical protein
MKGVVFNLLQQVVTAEHGEDVWDDLVDAAGVSGAYTSLGSYSDDEIMALVGAACEKLQASPATVLRWFGQKAMPLLAKSYPDFFTPHENSRSFVRSVNDIIHVEVRKLYVGAECPYFHFKETDDGALRMDYRSSRRLCALAQGFVEGAAAHYGEDVDFEHETCIERGDATCVFRIRWPAMAAAA